MILLLFLGLSVRIESSEFPSLQLGTSARPAGLGLAYTAVANDASAGFWNPAGLAGFGRSEIEFSHHRWIQGVTSQFLGFAWGGDRSGAGIHLLYTEVGDIAHRVVPSETPLATFSNRELAAGFSYGRRIGRSVRVGVTVKALYEKLFVDDAWGVAADLGFLWKFHEDGIQIGGVVQNIGRTQTLRSERIRLPLTARLGLAVPFEALFGGWLVAVDGVMERDEPFHVHTGMEYCWHEFLFLRLGYQTGYDTRDITGGVGFAWKGYRFDYSIMPMQSSLGDSHRLTVGFQF